MLKIIKKKLNQQGNLLDDIIHNQIFEPKLK